MSIIIIRNCNFAPLGDILDIKNYIAKPSQKLMPTITVELEEGVKTIEVEPGTRLVLALADNGIDISHRCGGNARCTTCRCAISSGAPQKMTRAEKDKIEASIEKGDASIKQARLSCQILVEQDMSVKPLKRVKDMDWDAPGGRPADSITPSPEWID